MIVLSELYGAADTRRNRSSIFYESVLSKSVDNFACDYFLIVF